MLPTTTTNQLNNNNEDNLANLEEDDEEIRRLENMENYIPFTMPNQTNEKYKQVDTEQLEYMQRLLNNRTALLSDDLVKNIKDLWSDSIDRDQRQNLYRYWLWKYVQVLIGLKDLFLFFLLRFFVLFS